MIIYCFLVLMFKWDHSSEIYTFYLVPIYFTDFQGAMAQGSYRLRQFWLVNMDKIFWGTRVQIKKFWLVPILQIFRVPGSKLNNFGKSQCFSFLGYQGPNLKNLVNPNVLTFREPGFKWKTGLSVLLFQIFERSWFRFRNCGQSQCVRFWGPGLWPNN